MFCLLSIKTCAEKIIGGAIVNNLHTMPAYKSIMLVDDSIVYGWGKCTTFEFLNNW